jgi:hypothetical protein
MLTTSTKSKISFDSNYLKNNTKQLVHIDPIIKLNKIYEILLKDKITSDDESTLYNFVVSLDNQHDDNFYKSCSIKSFTIDYLSNVWDIILRTSKNPRLKDIRKYILIGFNLYTKCFKDVRILLFVLFLTIHDVNNIKVEVDVKNIIKYQLIVNEYLKNKFL